MKNIAFTISNKAEVMAVFALADTLNIKVYDGTRDAFMHNFDNEVKEYGVMNYNGTRISSSLGFDRYEDVTFGGFVTKLSEMTNAIIQLNGDYSVIIRDGHLDVSNNEIDISIVEDMLALLENGRTIKTRDAVITHNVKEIALITTIGRENGVEVETIKGGNFKEIIFNEANGENYLSGNHVRSGNYNYVSLVDFLTGMVEPTKQLKVLGHNVTLSHAKDYFEIGCQNVSVDKIKEVRDAYYKINKK